MHNFRRKVRTSLVYLLMFLFVYFYCIVLIKLQLEIQLITTVELEYKRNVSQIVFLKKKSYNNNFKSVIQRSDKYNSLETISTANWKRAAGSN